MHRVPDCLALWRASVLVIHSLASWLPGAEMNTQPPPRPQRVHTLAQMGNRMAWREWKVPGIGSIREKRLHCGNDPECEG